MNDHGESSPSHLCGTPLDKSAKQQIDLCFERVVKMFPFLELRKKQTDVNITHALSLPSK